MTFEKTKCFHYLPIGSITVTQVSLPKAVEPDHRGHGQVRWYQGHKQASILEYQLFHLKCMWKLL